MKKGFTIVELLIVIVVIGILAAITIVSFNGIQNRAQEAATQASLTQARDKVKLYEASSSGLYPITLVAAGVDTSSASTSYQYSSTGSYYCLVAQTGSASYFTTSTLSIIMKGTCYGLAGWWPLNGSASDISGNNRNGIINGATLTTGQNGSPDTAYNFSDTATQWIDTGYNFPLEQFTVSLWARPSGSSVSNYATLISNSRDCCSVYNGFQIDYYKTDPGSIRARLWAGSSSAAATPFYNGMALNTWQYITMTYDQTTAKLYMNGALVSSKSYIGTIGASAYDVFIGRGGWSGSGYTFGGNIDDVRIYDHALTANEIGGTYAAGTL